MVKTTKLNSNSLNFFCIWYSFFLTFIFSLHGGELKLPILLLYKSISIMVKTNCYYLVLGDLVLLVIWFL